MQKIIPASPVLYNPADLYKGYPDGHEDRQSYITDKEQMLRLQIREKQKRIK